MDDPIEINRRNWDERAAIHAREALGDTLARFRAGEDALLAMEAAELGDISAKRVLHLQCHIGRDTLCLARRGAVVTGLDFSPTAIEVARRLSEETGLRATFIQGTVDQTPRLAPGPFDLVFTTWGTLCWLPDMRDWAKVIASVLAPDGELYCADAHPSFVMLEEQTGRLLPTFDFQTPSDRPLEFVDAEPTTYLGDPTPMTHRATRVWIHSLSAIFGSLIDAGLTITMFREHEVLPWRRYAAEVTVRPGETFALSGDAQSLVPATDRMWRLRDGHPRMPLSFSLRAKKLIYAGPGRGKRGTKAALGLGGPSNKELQVTKRRLSCARRLKALPKGKKKAYIQELKNEGKGVTPNAVVAKSRQEAKQTKKYAIQTAAFSADGPFDVAVIDWPWKMEKIDRDDYPNQDAFDYPTMTTDEMIAFWQRDLVPRLKPDLHLFQWTTQKYLPTALNLAGVFECRYVLTMVWLKPGGFQPLDLPQYNVEFIIYARRGTPLFVDTKQFNCGFTAPRREHSRKPDEFYDTIRRVTGGSRIDVFSREPREGFAHYGNEIMGFAA
jgi:N6-adenosine-specific RNA methylase IME4/SAM-dependent methyltransferase